MLAQDLALISVEIVIKARIATAKAFATVLTLWHTQEPRLLPPDVLDVKEDTEDTPTYKAFDDLCRPLLGHYVN